MRRKRTRGQLEQLPGAGDRPHGGSGASTASRRSGLGSGRACLLSQVHVLLRRLRLAGPARPCARRTGRAGRALRRSAGQTHLRPPSVVALHMPCLSARRGFQRPLVRATAVVAAASWGDDAAWCSSGYRGADDRRGVRGGPGGGGVPCVRDLRVQRRRVRPVVLAGPGARGAGGRGDCAGSSAFALLRGRRRAVRAAGTAAAAVLAGVLALVLTGLGPNGCPFGQSRAAAGPEAFEAGRTTCSGDRSLR